MVRTRKDGTPVWKANEEAQKKYDAANTLRFNVKLNRRTDADIIDALETASNKQGFIKDAIRFYLSHMED